MTPRRAGRDRTSARRSSRRRARASPRARASGRPRRPPRPSRANTSRQARRNGPPTDASASKSRSSHWSGQRRTGTAWALPSRAEADQAADAPARIAVTSHASARGIGLRQRLAKVGPSVGASRSTSAGATTEPPSSASTRRWRGRCASACSISQSSPGDEPRRTTTRLATSHQLLDLGLPLVVADVEPRRAELGQGLARLADRDDRTDRVEDVGHFLLGRDRRGERSRRVAPRTTARPSAPRRRRRTSAGRAPAAAGRAPSPGRRRARRTGGSCARGARRRSRARQ